MKLSSMSPIRTLILYCLIGIIQPVQAQTAPEIQNLATNFGEDLYNRCSSVGGKSLYTTVFAYYYLESADAVKITMQVNWKGGLTGWQYYIKGNLYVYESGRMYWKKIKDSGGFAPNCSSWDYGKMLDAGRAIWRIWALRRR